MRLPRPRRGADNPASRLTPDQARTLRARYLTGETSLRGLAADAGVHHRTVWRIVSGHSYPDRK